MLCIILLVSAREIVVQEATLQGALAKKTKRTSHHPVRRCVGQSNEIAHSWQISLSHECCNSTVYLAIVVTQDKIIAAEATLHSCKHSLAPETPRPPQTQPLVVLRQADVSGLNGCFCFAPFACILGILPLFQLFKILLFSATQCILLQWISEHPVLTQWIKSTLEFMPMEDFGFFLQDELFQLYKIWDPFLSYSRENAMHTLVFVILQDMSSLPCLYDQRQFLHFHVPLNLFILQFLEEINLNSLYFKPTPVV